MKLISIVFLASLLPSWVAAFSSPAPPSVPRLEMDVEKAFAESTFPIKPDDLIVRAKEVLSPEIQIGLEDGGECLAEDFEFVAAIVGPIGKKEFVSTLGGFKLTDSFAIDQNAFGFTVSPMQPNRVFWFGYAEANMTAPFVGVPVEKAKQTELSFPPQVFHFDFNEEGKLTEFGFYVVDRRYGNTGGLGGAFGYFYGIGKPLPFPEGKPYKPSFRLRTLNMIGKLAQRLMSKKEASD